MRSFWTLIALVAAVAAFCAGCAETGTVQRETVHERVVAEEMIVQ